MTATLFLVRRTAQGVNHDLNRVREVLINADDGLSNTDILAKASTALNTAIGATVFPATYFDTVEQIGDLDSGPLSEDGNFIAMLSSIISFEAAEGGGGEGGGGEGGGENLAVASEDFSNPAWVSNGATVTTDTDANPVNGQQTADTVTDDQSEGIENLLQAIAVPVDTTVYTFSIFVGKTVGATSFPIIQLAYNDTGAVEPQLFALAILDTNNGTFAAGPPAGETTVVTDEGTYWRVAITLANDGAHDEAELGVFPSASTDGASPSPAAMGSIVVFGAQFEAAAEASEYTPST